VDSKHHLEEDVMSTGMKPLPLRIAAPRIARSAGRTAQLLVRRRLHQPRPNVGRRLIFADGATGRVYRETVVDRPVADPAVLVVEFRLRGVRGVGHRLFRAESELNTPLFAGFPGFVSKLWLAHDERGRYRGIYQWDGPQSAEDYARALWWALILVSDRDSIHYRVLPSRWRDEWVADTLCSRSDSAPVVDSSPRGGGGESVPA
jgi:hypothetical protein